MDHLQFVRLTRSLDSLSQQISKISSTQFKDMNDNTIYLNSHTLSHTNNIYKPRPETKATFCILLHTHSEYSFLWKATISLLEKYAPHFKIYWCCDSLLDYVLPSHWVCSIYNKEELWSYRIKRAIDMIDSEYILYLQEDWLLIDTIDIDKINYLTAFMKEKNCEFLMSDIRELLAEPPIPTIYENYEFQRINGHWMQPAIWKKELLYKISCLDISLKDNEIKEAYQITKKSLCYCIRNTRYKEVSTRTLYFPHMHSLFSGKWTFVKYPCLKALVESYGIDTSTRDIDTKWIVDYQ